MYIFSYISPEIASDGFKTRDKIEEKNQPSERKLTIPVELKLIRKEINHSGRIIVISIGSVLYFVFIFFNNSRVKLMLPISSTYCQTSSR